MVGFIAHEFNFSLVGGRLCQFFEKCPFKTARAKNIEKHLTRSDEVSLQRNATATIKPSSFSCVLTGSERDQCRRRMSSPTFLCFSWPVCLRVMVLWEPAWLHQRSPTNHCNCAVPKPPSPTLGLNHEIFENAGVKRGGSLAVQREMWDHRASLTRRRIESQPAFQSGSQGTQWSPLKENNYGCKRRYCAGSRSIVPTFCWRWGQCISVTAGESAGYQLVAGGTHRSLNTGGLPR